MFALVTVFCFVGLSVQDLDIQPCNQEKCEGPAVNQQLFTKQIDNGKNFNVRNQMMKDLLSALDECGESCLGENILGSTLTSPSVEVVDDMEDEVERAEQIIPTPSTVGPVHDCQYNASPPQNIEQSSGVQLNILRGVLSTITIFVFYFVLM